MADVAATPIPEQRPVYLGDGLYAEFDGWEIRLFAHNGVSSTNQVFLEPSVLVAFLRYVEDLKTAVSNVIG
jgi:hypothetical protein